MSAIILDQAIVHDEALRRGRPIVFLHGGSAHGDIGSPPCRLPLHLIALMRSTSSVMATPRMTLCITRLNSKLRY